MPRPKLYADPKNVTLTIDGITKDCMFRLAREDGLSAGQLVTKLVNARWAEKHPEAKIVDREAA